MAVYQSERPTTIIDPNTIIKHDNTIDNQTITTTRTEKAGNTITVSAIAPTTVEASGNLTLLAAKEIILKPGFTVKPGATFTAQIDTSIKTSIISTKLTLKEHHIYGSARLGLQEKNLLLYDSDPVAPPTSDDKDLYKSVIGDKRYELSNHLGNVLSVISDEKLVDSANGTTFKPDVLSYSDYYPFGMLVPNRHGSADSYRYGFNGKELDNEIKGDGNSYDFGARMLDVRIGRFFSIDKLDSATPSSSGYSMSGNSPIYKIDSNGDIEIIVHYYKKFKGKYYEAGTYKMYIKTDEDIKDVTRDVMHINAYTSYDSDLSPSENKSTFKGITSYAIRKGTGLNNEEKLKKENTGYYILGKFMQKNPLGTGAFIEYMEGVDIMTGEKLDGLGKAKKLIDGTVNLITLGRASSGSEIIKGWATDFFIEESLNYLLTNENLSEGDMLNKVAMFVYQTAKLNSVDKKKVFETLNAIYSKGIKGHEMLEQFYKETNIDLTAPKDKYQAAKKAVKIINSEL